MVLEGYFGCIFGLKLGLLFCSQCIKRLPGGPGVKARLFLGLNCPHIAQKYLFFGVFAILFYMLYNRGTKEHGTTCLEVLSCMLIDK